jgi:hypothetical protein
LQEDDQFVRRHRRLDDQHQDHQGVGPLVDDQLQGHLGAHCLAVDDSTPGAVAVYVSTLGVGGHGVRRLLGGAVTTIAGGGGAGFADGLGAAAAFSSPWGDV